MTDKDHLKILIIVGNLQFIRSLKNLILEVTNDERTVVEYSYNGVAGIRKSICNQYDYIFIDIDDYTNIIELCKECVAKNIKLIAISFKPGVGALMKQKKTSLTKILEIEEMDIDHLLQIFQPVNKKKQAAI